jgi:hypothetical protein
MRTQFLAVMMLIAAGWLGCSSNKEAVLKPESPTSLVTHVLYHDTSLCVAQKSVSTVSLNVQGKKEKVQMVAFVNHPNLIKIEVYGTMGVAIVQLVIQDRGVMAYFPLEKKLIEGSIGSPIMQRALGIDISLEDILNFYIRMRISPEDVGGQPTSGEVLQQRHVLTYRQNDAQVRYWINSSYAVEKKEWLTMAGAPKKTMTFKKYKIWNNMQRFPASVTLDIPETWTTVEMTFQERELMVERLPIETFRLSIPDGVSPIKLE